MSHSGDNASTMSSSTKCENTACPGIAWPGLRWLNRSNKVAWCPKNQKKTAKKAWDETPFRSPFVLEPGRFRRRKERYFV